MKDFELIARRIRNFEKDDIELSLSEKRPIGYKKVSKQKFGSYVKVLYHNSCLEIYMMELYRQKVV